MTVAEPQQPQPTDCPELGKRLSELTEGMQAAIDKREDDTVKVLYESIVDVLRRTEKSRDLADKLAPLYEELIGACFSGDEEAIKKILDEIRAILAG